MGSDDVGVIEYALTEDDMVAFATAPFTSPFLWRSPAMWRFKMFAAALVILIILGLIVRDADWLYDPNVRLKIVGIAGLIVIGVLLTERHFTAWRIKREVRRGKHATFMERRRLEISPAGIKSTSALIEIVTRWPAISRIQISSLGIYVIIAPRQGYVVPRRAFADDADYAGFVKAARELHRRFGYPIPPERVVAGKTAQDIGARRGM